VRRDIEGDGPELRFAALRGGTGRLAARLATLLLQLTEDESRAVRSAAITALSDFPTEAAIERLAELTQSEDPGTVRDATRGLADSRFPRARRRLQELLESVGPEPHERIAQVLIETPRAESGDLYFQYASDTKSRLALRAMQALRQIGHPQLRSLLARALNDENASIRREAYRQLAGSSDPDDQAVALADTLRRISDAPPTGEMLACFNELVGWCSSLKLSEPVKAQMR